MKPVYTIYKFLGETPLEALERLRKEEGIPAHVSMTYAGRLDPAAEGLLIILTGEECKKKEEYTVSDKTYMAEILIGVSTDSYDLLGMPKYGGEGINILKIAQGYLDASIGAQMQKYPPYSSKTVDGEQLHTHARAGTDVELPVHEVMLHEYTDLSIETIEKEDVLMRVGELTSSVTGDFRQKEIVEAWAELALPEKLPLLSVTLKVGSGFYIRQLAEDLGKILGVGACLYSLVRTSIS
jgi:tRNA pseudouridine55 synthase